MARVTPDEVTEVDEVEAVDFDADADTDTEFGDQYDSDEYDEDDVESDEDEGEDEDESDEEGDEDDEEEVDITDFENLAESVAGAADPASGTLTEEQINEVAESYRDLEGAKRKARARGFVEQRMYESVSDNNIIAARAWMELQTHMKAAPAKKGGARKPRKPVDNTAAYAEKLAMLDLARALGGEVVPENVDAATAEQKQGELYSENYEACSNYVEWLNKSRDERGDEPEVEPFVKQAAKLAVGKATRATGGGGTRSTYSGPRRSVKAHITSAVAAANVGDFLKVADIVNHTSDEYGDDKPSSGAVSSALKSKNFSMEGVEVGENEGLFGLWKRA